MALCIGQDMFTGDSGCHDNGLLSIWGRSICSCTVSTVFLCSYFWGSFLFLFPPSDGLSFNAFVLWMTVFHCPLEVSSLMASAAREYMCISLLDIGPKGGNPGAAGSLITSWHLTTAFTIPSVHKCCVWPSCYFLLQDHLTFITLLLINTADSSTEDSGHAGAICATLWCHLLAHQVVAALQQWNCLSLEVLHHLSILLT